MNMKKGIIDALLGVSQRERSSLHLYSMVIGKVVHMILNNSQSTQR